ncbi:TetR family transcriptional regulator [Microbacterium resistens]|uniref:TetR family transcriptional regulator n=1 Tax=Microbacterium resistens TaxID=156977 RepID=UPI0008310F6E|nr:TetR family transcriptional regulator [Microbacterium resistens]
MTPPSPGRHDRERIVSVAVDLLDRVGLPDLTMRRLAGELDVQASALYWHFSSKQDLLAAVADRILERPLPPSPPGAGPDDRLLTVARGIRDALLACRDGAEVVLSTAAMRRGASRAHDAIVDALPGVDARNAPAATAILQFILGHTNLVQQRMHAESHGAAAEHDGAAADAVVFDLGIRMLGAGLRGEAASAVSPATADSRA